MALTDEGNSGIPATMLVSPTNMGGGLPYPVYMGGGSQGSNSNGNGWDNGWWIILLFILLASGNWGGNQNGQGGGFGGSQPIIVNDGNGGSVQRGFDQAAVMSGINGVQSGVQNLSTQLCNCCCDMQNTVNNGFFGVQNALCNGFNGVEQSANARQMANMQTAFAAQTAMSQGFNQLGSQFADCCCENRLASADLKYTIATEECATRNADAMNTNSVLNAINGGIQSIKDQLCADKIDAKNDEIAQLRQELLYARGQASQDVQTATLRQSDATTANQLIAELRSCPIPSMPVYGQTPIFTCPQNNSCGCGCGCGNNF